MLSLLHPPEPAHLFFSLAAAAQQNSTTVEQNRTISFNSYGTSVANLAVDGVTITIMWLVLIPCLVVYFKRQSWKIVNNLFVNLKKCFGNDSNQKTSRDFFYILIHSTVAFVIFRIGVEIVTILQHYYDLANIYTPFIISIQVRRIVDYISMYWYLLNYSLMIPIWLKVCIVWFENRRRRVILTWIVYILLIICNILAVLGLIPVTVVAIMALAIELPTRVATTTFITATTFNSERYRSLFSYAITVPLLGSSTAIVFFMSIVAVAIIVSALRRANKLHPEDSEVYKMQKQTIIKLTSGVAIIGVGAVIESIGVAVSTVAPNYLMYPLAKLIPYSTLAICVSLIFWPYKLPIINSEPFHFVIQELKFKAKEMIGIQNHSTILLDEEETTVQSGTNNNNINQLRLSMVELELEAAVGDSTPTPSSNNDNTATTNTTTC